MSQNAINAIISFVEAQQRNIKMPEVVVGRTTTTTTNNRLYFYEKEEELAFQAEGMTYTKVQCCN